jgi:hypothetical protein
MHGQDGGRTSEDGVQATLPCEHAYLFPYTVTKVFIGRPTEILEIVSLRYCQLVMSSDMPHAGHVAGTILAFVCRDWGRPRGTVARGRTRKLLACVTPSKSVYLGYSELRVAMFALTCIASLTHISALHAFCAGSSSPKTHAQWHSSSLEVLKELWWTDGWL